MTVLRRLFCVRLSWGELLRPALLFLVALDSFFPIDRAVPAPKELKLHCLPPRVFPPTWLWC